MTILTYVLMFMCGLLLPLAIIGLIAIKEWHNAKTTAKTEKQIKQTTKNEKESA